MWWLLVVLDGTDARSVRCSTLPWSDAERADVVMEMLCEVVALAGLHPSVAFTFDDRGPR